MSEFNELYQQIILDHSRHPRNFREMEACENHAKGHNPLCGDRIDVFLKIEGGVISDASFRGQGCAISQSSASIMTELLKGKTPEEARRMYENFHAVVTGEGSDAAQDLGKLEIFAGVRNYPSRVKCASLAWHTMKNALESGQEIIKTE